MDYNTLNEINKGKMRGTCNNDEHFEWEDSEFLEIMKGRLPKTRNYSYNSEVQSLYSKLSSLCDKYDFFNVDQVAFKEELQSLIEKIRGIEPYWNGVDLYDISDAMKMHKFCLVSGEGGIGKSYFVKSLEEELTQKQIKHLCVYGKFTKDVSIIDFEEIKKTAESETFVFVFDAINEIPQEQQELLLGEIKKIKSVKGIRFLITYRSYTMNDAVLQQFISISEYTYKFPGVSFESVVEWLQKTTILDVNEYIDILYSNNPFLLSKLPLIFEGQQHNPGLNDISRVTRIYEQFIKRSIDRPTWEKTKEIARILYENNEKTFTLDDIKCIDDPSAYVAVMKQRGLLGQSLYDGKAFYYFEIESLADFLIVRHMWDELNGKALDDCIRLIKEKTLKFGSLNHETIILMLFDKFSPKYDLIKRILVETDLIDSISYEILLKVHFKPENIDAFLNTFKVSTPSELIVYFSGYVNKPFNCTNYLNNYYTEDVKRHMGELSTRLSGKHFLSSIKGRLKNMLYFTCKCPTDKERASENLYTAVWCSGACNTDIRILSTKLLYETIQRNPELVKIAIDFFGKVNDGYIRDAIVYSLSCCEFNTEIETFFRKLLDDEDFTLAKSIRRVSHYIGKTHEYISLIKKNYLVENSGEVSEQFTQVLHHVDLIDKNLLPFRIWNLDTYESNVKFLNVDKGRIGEFNNRVLEMFDCVKNGECNGSFGFQEDVERLLGVSYHKQRIETKNLLAAFESVFQDVLHQYGFSFEYEKLFKYSDEFSCSTVHKCICITIDILWGSLMCNYYVDEFATYNNRQNSIGYEVYDPIEYEEEYHIQSPVCVYQPQIEKMGDFVLNRMETPLIKDEKWWRDLEITKRNILSILEPFSFDDVEWTLLSCRISFQDKTKEKWIDTYDTYVCCSAEETLRGDGEERYLTIETDNYTGNLNEYHLCKERPWLCKSVPTISYSSGLFEDTRLYLPPASIVAALDLKFDINRMCWIDSEGHVVILCNNNKSSYYNDPIMSTIFIRKDAYEKLQKNLPIKYFAFAEKLLGNRGYCDETDYHFEIIDDIIVKAIPNHQSYNAVSRRTIPSQCLDCPYGFYEEFDESSPLHEFLINYRAEYSE